MNTFNQILLNSPLSVASISELYNRLIIALPDKLELINIALLDAQDISGNRGDSPTVLIEMLIDAIHPDVIQTYCEVTGISQAAITKMISGDIYDFVKMTTRFYSQNKVFNDLKQIYMAANKYMQIYDIQDSDKLSQSVTVILRDITHEQYTFRSNRYALLYNTDIPFI